MSGRGDPRADKTLTPPTQPPPPRGITTKGRARQVRVRPPCAPGSPLGSRGEGWKGGRSPRGPAIGRQGGPRPGGLPHAGREPGPAEGRWALTWTGGQADAPDRQTHLRTDRRTARGSGTRRPGRSGSRAGMDSGPGETDRERKGGGGGGGGGGPGRGRGGRERASREEGPGRPPGAGGRRKRAGTGPRR